jgi:ribosomal-protein-alanine N-acetyltransferase
MVLEATFHDLAVDDLDDVLEIEHVSFQTPWSKAAFVHEIEFDKSVFKAVKIGGRLVGYGGFWHILDEIHISNIAIHPAYRRRGLATRLLVHLLEEALDRGASTATLEVRRSNVAAQKLYGSFGFIEIGVRKYYYVKENEDALIMWTSNIAASLATAHNHQTEKETT